MSLECSGIGVEDPRGVGLRLSVIRGVAVRFGRGVDEGRKSGGYLVEFEVVRG